MSSSVAIAPLSPATRALAARADPEELIAAVAGAVATEAFAEHVGDPVFMAAMQASVRDNVGGVLSIIAGTSTLADIRPPANFALTDLLAEMGVPISEVERSYWVGVRQMWQEWFALARAAAEAGEGTLEEFVGTPTQLMLQAVIEVISLVVGRYDAVSDAIRRTRDDKRRMLLAQMVDGSLTAATAEVEQTLGYRLDGTHLGLAVEVSGRGDAERVCTELISAIGARGSLLILHAPALWLIWLGLVGPPGTEALTRLDRALSASGATLCVGDPARGITGFLQTRRDALEVAALRRSLGRSPAVLWFRDVRLELFLMRDETAARRFVTDELGELAGAGERLGRARETLLDWLSTGSASQTATRFHVHENTIRSRISQAEEMLPRDLSTRRAELMVALRLRTMLGDPPAPGGQMSPRCP